ncbi:MAG TPA: biotin/lipoyl-containing protein, partial [Rhodanobacteraceae bacterium]|nr:biotin/lipoyl-containing protein [Rhodanobacteraceae bacterium]
MAQTIELKVPDIGDFHDVPVIEVMVKPGDHIERDQGLVTLESAKATMEVPASSAGTIKEVRVKVGDSVEQGSVIAVVEAEGDAESKKQPDTAKASPPSPAGRGAGDEDEETRLRDAGGTRGSERAANDGRNGVPHHGRLPVQFEPSPSGETGRKPDLECRMLVLGSGPGGYSAAFRAADLGLDTVLVERYGTLGGVCLNVGCIPSKALLHVAKVLADAQDAATQGVTFGKPELDVDKLRGWKETVVKKLTGGLVQLAKQRKVTVVNGVAQFLDP